MEKEQYQFGTGNSGGGGSGSGGSGGSGNEENRKSTDIKINEPPTFIKILWDQETIRFYNTQERYLRVITVPITAIRIRLI